MTRPLIIVLGLILAPIFAFAQVEASFGVSRSDVLGGVDGSARVEAADVGTSSDLRAYAHTTMSEDERVDALQFSPDAIVVHYRQKGRLLALVPVTFTVVARAQADGQVEVRYPWYSFLTVDNEQKIATEMKVAVDSALHERLVGSVRAAGERQSFTASEAAEVATQMNKVLRANFDTQASVDSAVE